LAKRLFRHAMGPTLEMYLEQEELAQVCSKRTDDFAEGVAAFKEKRAVRFTGR
jgi:2-(1,2-epoxy-1,2-dihydrophenyl)acetyl-CoA isomerase